MHKLYLDFYFAHLSFPVTCKYQKLTAHACD